MTLCAIGADVTIVIRVVGAKSPALDGSEAIAENVSTHEGVAEAEVQGEVLGGTGHGGGFVHDLVPAVVGEDGLDDQAVAEGVGETGHVDQDQPVIA